MKFLEVNNLDIEYQTRKETIYASKNVSFNHGGTSYIVFGDITNSIEHI